MKKLANIETDQDVNAFIEAIPNQKRKADAKVLLALIKEVKELEPKIWGKSIVGFGKYKYQRKNGDEFEWFNVGFSPGRAHITLYLMYDINKEVKLLNKLGEHKTGKGCLYIKNLENANMKVLEELIFKSDRWS